MIEIGANSNIPLHPLQRGNRRFSLAESEAGLPEPRALSLSSRVPKCESRYSAYEASVFLSLCRAQV